MVFLLGVLLVVVGLIGLLLLSNRPRDLGSVSQHWLKHHRDE